MQVVNDLRIAGFTNSRIERQTKGKTLTTKGTKVHEGKVKDFKPQRTRGELRIVGFTTFRIERQNQRQNREPRRARRYTGVGGRGRPPYTRGLPERCLT